jgi:hypothetical protein
MRARKFAAGTALAVALAAVLVVAPAGVASAHEGRELGPYEVEVGFGEEPTYAGFENSVAMFIHDHDSGDAVTDLGPTLQVQVEYQNQKMDPMTMEPNFEVGEFGEPGDYRAFFIPTRPGDYTFHFTGDIKGTKVDESFTSGPDTFSTVDDPSSIEFPVKDPTNGELGEAVQRIQPRVEAAVAAQRKAESQVAALQDDVDSANSMATIALIVGGVLGLVGAVAGLAGLSAARKARRAGGPGASTAGAEE